MEADITFPATSFTPDTVTVYTVPADKAAEGVKVAVEPLLETVPVTEIDPFLRVTVDVVTVEASTASLKVMVTVLLVETEVAFSAGRTVATVGGVVSAVAAVVKLQVLEADITFPAASFTPDTVTVYTVPADKAAEGVKVAVLPVEETVPVTAVEPFFSVMVEELAVEASTASLKVMVTALLVETEAAFSAGTTDATVGGVVSVVAPAPVVKLQVKFISIGLPSASFDGSSERTGIQFISCQV